VDVTGGRVSVCEEEKEGGREREPGEWVSDEDADDVVRWSRSSQMRS
jgi:hypothetical protein